MNLLSRVHNMSGNLPWMSDLPTQFCSVQDLLLDQACLLTVWDSIEKHRRIKGFRGMVWMVRLFGRRHFLMIWEWLKLKIEVLAWYNLEKTP